MIAWTPWGLPGTLAGLILFVIAATIWQSGPTKPQNRALALYLLVVAFDLGVGIWGGVALLAARPDAFWGALMVQFVSAVLFFPTYTGFLRTIDSPLSDPLRRTAVRAFIWILAASLLVLFLSRPTLFFTAVAPAVSGGTWNGVPTSHALMFQSTILLLYLYGLAVAVSAYRRARGTSRHRQMTAYMFAFGIYDSLMVALVLLTLSPAWQSGSPAAWAAGHLIPPFAALAFAGLVAYGVLHAQMFDIDLKIKWTIKRSTLIALFVAFFFVVSESAAVVFTERVGPVLGILGAGLLLFAIAPLQRFADRVADTAMPQVKDTPTYRAQRREEVFRGTVEELVRDNVLTAKERMALLRLQRDLGLDASRANLIEQQVLEARGTG